LKIILCLNACASFNDNLAEAESLLAGGDYVKTEEGNPGGIHYPLGNDMTCRAGVMTHRYDDDNVEG